MKLMNKIVCATLYACSMVFAADVPAPESPYAFKSVNLEFVDGENFPRPGKTTADEDAVRALVAKHNAATESFPSHQTLVLDDTAKAEGSFDRGRLWTHGKRAAMGNAYVMNISEDGKSLLMLGKQGNCVFGPNEYEQDILRAYASHDMGAYSESYKADPVEFVAGSLILDPGLATDDINNYVNGMLSLVHGLIDAKKPLPLGGKEPRHFTLHYHPDDPMVELLTTNFGFEVVHVDGARDDYWLWNIPSATPVEAANNQHRRVMLLKKFPVVADASAAAGASA